MKTKLMALLRSYLADSKRKAFMNVLAEETKTDTTTDNPETVTSDTKTDKKEDPKPSGSVNFEDLIAKARKDERDKLYPQIEQLKKEKNDLLLVVGERDNTIADLQKQVDSSTKTAKKLEADLKDGTKTNKTVSEQTVKISTLERQLEELQVKYETDINSMKLESYKKEKIAEAQGNIIPELVTGNTEEEVNEAIERAKARYDEITQNAVKNVQLPTANPSANSIQVGKDLAISDIQSMTPAQWAEYRKNAGLK